MQTNTYEGLHIVNETQSITSDELVVEAPLQININGEAYTVVMRTPDDDQDLVLGLLYAEDIYKNSQPIPFEIVEEKYGIPSIINVNIAPDALGKGYLNKRTLLSVSSCGICGKQQLEDIALNGNKIEKKVSFSSESLLDMFTPLKNTKKLLKKPEVVMLQVFLIIILNHLPSEKTLEDTMPWTNVLVVYCKTIL